MIIVFTKTLHFFCVKSFDGIENHFNMKNLYQLIPKFNWGKIILRMGYDEYVQYHNIYSSPVELSSQMDP